MGCNFMKLKRFIRPDKEKIIISGAILIISIIFIIIGIHFGGIHPILRLFFIAVSFFYLPILLLPEIVYSIIPSMRPDMDTMIASQFNFQIGLMFALGCVYAYLVSCIIVFVRRRKSLKNYEM